MKISSEAKAGIIGMAAIVILIWGINFLKGRNIFNSTYTLYSFYEESGGIEKSAPVLFSGVKIGYVEDVILRMNESPAVKIIMKIEKPYSLGTGSEARLFSADLMGTKAIRITCSESKPGLQDMDTITGIIEPDLISNLQTRLFPILEKTDRLARSLDSLSGQMDQLLARDALTQTLDNIAELSKALKISLSDGGSLDESFKNLEDFTSVMEGEKEEMASLVRNLNSISESLSRAGIDTLSAGITDIVYQFNHLMQHLNSGEGSAGKIFYSDSMYNHILVLIRDLDNLVSDLKENPEDYVQISLFGKSRE